MFLVCVEFETDPNQTDAFMAAVSTNGEQSFKQKSGCQQFDVCQDRQLPNSVFYLNFMTMRRRSKHTNLHCIMVHLITLPVVWS